MVEATPISGLEIQTDASPSAGVRAPVRDDRRLADLFRRYYDFAWRSLRRLGVDDGDLDDAAQEVFWVVSRRLGDIQEGRERSFIFGTAMRVASDARRSSSRRRPADGGETIEDVPDTGPDTEVRIDQKRAQRLLVHILDGMPEEQRIVFVLFELEGITMREIADDLGLRAGTVASRLRRARNTFQASVARIQARDQRLASER